MASNDNLYPLRTGNMVTCPHCQLESISWAFTCMKCGFDFDENRMPPPVADVAKEEPS
jgi:uncharacterized protein (DUF983 family)